MDTGRWPRAWLLLGLGMVAMATAEPDPYRRRFGDETRRRRLNVVTIQSDPYTRLNWAPGLIGNERYEGYYIDLVNKLADLAGFEAQLHLVGDGKLGHHGEEGGWTGMVGEIISQTADLTLGPLSITRERQDVVDFTSPIAEVKLAILMAKATSSPRSKTQTIASVTTLPELLSRGHLKFAALRDSDAIRALMTSLDSNARALYRRLQEQSMTSLMGNMYEALEFVRREGYALILDLPTAEYYVGRAPCDLVVVASFLEGRHYALATRKGVPLLGEINRALETLKGQRLQWKRLRRKWWMPQCPGMPTGGASAGVAETNGGRAEKPNGVDYALSDVSTRSSSPTPHLNVVTQLSAPFVVRSPGGTLTGYTIDLLRHMARLVPFRYDVTFPRDDAGFGRRRRSRWSGMAGELVRGEVDLAAAPFTANRARDRVLSYTKPFLHSTLSILIRSATANDEFPIFIMEDLLNQTDYKYGVLRGSHLEKDLRNSREPVPSEIWKNIIKDKRANVVRTIEEGIRKVRTGKFALIVPSTYATFLSSKAPCDLMPVDQFMFITNYMFAVKRGNILVDKMDDAMIKLQEDGVLQMLFHKWWNTGECTGATDAPRPYGVVKNTTAAPKERQPSADWAHGLITFSTQWKNPVPTTIQMTLSTTPFPTQPKTTQDPIKHQPPTTEALDVQTSPDTSPMTSPTHSDITDDVTNSEMTSVMTSEQAVTYTVSSMLPKTKEESGRKHRHRHRHRDKQRGRERGRGRNRERKRKRNKHANNTTTTTTAQITTTSHLINDGNQRLEGSTRRGGIRTQTTTTTTMTTTTTKLSRSANPPPKPPRWNGKYVYEDDLLSTRSPDNFTINLELIPAEEDSIRIFPFTYRPHHGHRPPDKLPELEHEEETHKNGYVLPPTVAPVTRSGNRGNQHPTTPSIKSGIPWQTVPASDIIHKSEGDKTESILLYTRTNAINVPTPPSGKVVTYREEKAISRAVSIASPSTFIISIVCIVSVWGSRNSYGGMRRS